jgi:hypothetical protein
VTIWTKSYFISLAERVLATFIIVLIAAITKNAINYEGEDVINPIRVDWVNGFLLAGGAAILSLLKGVLANLVTKDGPSLSHSEKVIPPLPNTPAA